MKKPKHYLIFKILAGVFAVVTIVGIVLSVQGFGDFETNHFMVGGFMCTFGLFATVACAGIGFKPELAKLSVKSAKYIQQQNKEDLADMATTTAEIAKEAVTVTVEAVKEGLDESMYCKHCGKTIDRDSRFCKECGGEQ